MGLCRVCLLLIVLASLCNFTSAVSSNPEVDPLLCPPDTTATRLIPQEGTSKWIMGELKDDAILEAIFSNGQSPDENFSQDDLFVHTGGVYLLADPVQFDGVILQIKAFGLVTAEQLALYYSGVIDVSAYAYALTYTQDPDTNAYSVSNGPKYFYHSFVPATLPKNQSEILDWPVKKGDRIGVFIPHECTNYTYELYCPSQVNLLTNEGECASAYFSNNSGPGDEGNYDVGDLNNVQFEEVMVRLNIEALIMEDTPESPATPLEIILPVIVIFGTLFVIILVLATIALWHWYSKRRMITIGKSRSTSDAPKQLSTYYEVPIDSGSIPYLHGDLKDGNFKQLDLTNQTKNFSHTELPTPMSAQTPMSEFSLETSEGYSLMGKDGSKDAKTYINTYDNGYDNGYSKDDNGYSNPYEEGDYQEPYFEPATREEELIEQLSAKLNVTEIPPQELELCEEIGSGAFGTVYRGVWSHAGPKPHLQVKEEVAVKTVGEKVCEENRVQFLQEATIMGQFKHTNIVRIKGILSEKPMMIVLDLLRGGDLRNYLLTSVKNKLSTLEPLELGSMLLSYTRQVAMGMVCLGFKGYIHRDLAARNVLVSENGMICKIADFGLSRILQNENFYVSHGGKIPVKWTAPEALQYRKYSTASDVWSYGCVLYEIWSLGEKPFQDIANVEAMKYVTSGQRLPPPPGCPRAIYDIMIKCWHPNPDDRPTFCEIIQQLQQSDYHILKWSREDKNIYSEETRTIGSPLHLDNKLHKDLQDIYINAVSTDNNSNTEID